MAMASTESIREMLEPKYGVFAQVNRVLVQQHTYELLENNLWLLANITGDCHELCNLVMQETKLRVVSKMASCLTNAGLVWELPRCEVAARAALTHAMDGV